METASPARWARSLLILAALYGCFGAVVAVIEHLFYHHFETGPAHHVVIITVLLGCITPVGGDPSSTSAW